MDSAELLDGVSRNLKHKYCYTKGQILAQKDVPAPIAHLINIEASAQYYWVYPRNDDSFVFFKSVTIRVYDPEIVLEFS